MLHDVVDDPGARDDDELLAAHAARLAAAIDDVGVKAAAEATGLAPSTLRAVADGDVAAAGALDLEVVATVLALTDGSPAADDLLAAARDELLFGMTAGVLNVDVLAGEAAVDAEPREVQGMVEGRHPMTLREYAALQRAVADRAP